jgi:hypothetical protein
MRVLVCGSRHFHDYEKLKEELLKLHTPDGHKVDCIISGHAKGADSLGERFAEEYNIPCEIYPADWDKYGKAAGLIRNAQMLKEGKVGLVLAFLAPESRGTKNMIEQSIKVKKPVKVVNI